MSEKHEDQEINKDQLSNVSGGENGGFRHENEELIDSGDLSEGLLDEKKLTKVSGGTTDDDSRARSLEFDPEAKG